MTPTVMNPEQGLLSRITESLGKTNFWDELRGPLGVGLAGLARNPNLQPMLMEQFAKQQAMKRSQEAGARLQTALTVAEGHLAAGRPSDARAALNALNMNELPPELQGEIRKMGMRITEQEATFARRREIAKTLAEAGEATAASLMNVDPSLTMKDAIKASRDLKLTHDNFTVANGIPVARNLRTGMFENLPGVGGRRFESAGSVEILPEGGFGATVPTAPKTESITQTFGKDFSLALVLNGVKNISTFETKLRENDPEAGAILVKTATEFSKGQKPTGLKEDTRDALEAIGYVPERVEQALRSTDPELAKAATGLVQKAHAYIDGRKARLLAEEATAKALADQTIKKSMTLAEAYGPASGDVFNAKTLEPVTRSKTVGQSIADGDLRLDPKDAEAVRKSKQALSQVAEIERLGRKLFTSNDPLTVAMRAGKYSFQSWLSTNADARLMNTSQALMFNFARGFGNDSRISDPDQKFAADTSGLTFLQSKEAFTRTMARLKRIFTNTGLTAAGLPPLPETAFEPAGPRPTGTVIRPGGK